RARKRWGDRGPAGTPPSLRPGRLRSCLAGGTPVRDACVVALWPRANRGAAARAWSAGAPVDDTPMRTWRVHQRGGGFEEPAQVVVLDVAKQGPRRDPDSEERLRLPHVPDATDEALVEKRLPERP